MEHNNTKDTLNYDSVEKVVKFGSESPSKSAPFESQIPKIKSECKHT